MNGMPIMVDMAFNMMDQFNITKWLMNNVYQLHSVLFFIQRHSDESYLCQQKY